MRDSDHCFEESKLFLLLQKWCKLSNVLDDFKVTLYICQNNADDNIHLGVIQKYVHFLLKGPSIIINGSAYEQNSHNFLTPLPPFNEQNQHFWYTVMSTQSLYIYCWMKVWSEYINRHTDWLFLRHSFNSDRYLILNFWRCDRLYFSPESYDQQPTFFFAV